MKRIVREGHASAQNAGFPTYIISSAAITACGNRISSPGSKQHSARSILTRDDECPYRSDATSPRSLGLRVRRDRATLTSNAVGGEPAMIKLQRIGHILITVRDLDRSKAFYTGILGFQVLEQDP